MTLSGLNIELEIDMKFIRRIFLVYMNNFITISIKLDQ